MTNSDIKNSKPKILNETIYKSDSLVARHLLDWEDVLIRKDEETGILRIFFNDDNRGKFRISEAVCSDSMVRRADNGVAWNELQVKCTFDLHKSEMFHDGVYCKSTFAHTDGKLSTDFVFDYISRFSEGLCCVGIEGQGYGFINTQMEIVIPCQYGYARGFQNGYAVVSRIENGKVISGCVDKQGVFTVFQQKDGTPYASIDDCEDGLFMVSSKAVFCLAHLLKDKLDPVGIFGFVNAQGKEVIPPQYLSVCKPSVWSNGIAIVCKGHWSHDPKTASESHHFWPDSILWGGIDKTGKEVIPCIFDKIGYNLLNLKCGNAYPAHFGGWDNGKWGVIDGEGKWIVEPQFDGAPREMGCGLLTFRRGGETPDSEGIYDIDNQKVIFEPQFRNTSLLENGTIVVERLDDVLGRKIEEIINRNGEALFPSAYSSIHTSRSPYEVGILSESGYKHGLIDEKGNVILPCKYDVPWGGILPDLQRIAFNDGDKYGVMDFQENIIIPAKYEEIDHIIKDIWFAFLEENHRGIISENGDIVLDIKFGKCCSHSDTFRMEKGQKIRCLTLQSWSGEEIAYEKMMNNNNKWKLFYSNETGTSIFELEMLSEGNRQEDMKP